MVKLYLINKLLKKQLLFVGCSEARPLKTSANTREKRSSGFGWSGWVCELVKVSVAGGFGWNVRGESVGGGWFCELVKMRLRLTEGMLEG